MIEAINQLRVRGWIVLPSVVDTGLRERLTNAIEQAHVKIRKIQLANGVGEGTDGTVHHLPLIDDVFLEFLEQGYCGDILEAFFGGPYLLNAFGGVLNLPKNLSYVGGIHRDQRTFSGDLPLMGQLLVMLDDFTEDNGATYFLDGSHLSPEKPDKNLFFRKASRAVGRAGSIVVFNSNLWHAAGANLSATPRRALTLNFCKPYLKQQLDYPRALGYERGGSLSPTLRQLLGYNARVPESLEEWYQPADRRLYQRDQG
jgi:hypothetical protein